MASAVVGALRVDLSMDSAAFEAGSKKAIGGLGDISKAAKLAGAAIGTALVAASAAVAAGVKNTLAQADQMAKLAQKIGIPIEELSRLAHAADLSGVSLEGLATGVGKLSKNMLDAARTGTGPIAEAFDALDINVQNADGSLREASAVMTDIAGRFAGMEDGAHKTALAMTLLGRSGADLIPLFNSGADGLRSMMREADELGIVIDAKTAKAAEQFNDNLTRLGNIADGLIIKLTAELAPALASISDFLVSAALAATKVEENLDAISATAEDLGLKNEIVTGFFGALGDGASAALNTLLPLVGAMRLLRSLMPDPTEGGTVLQISPPPASVTPEEDPDLVKITTLQDLKAATEAATEAERARQAIEAEGVSLMEAMRTPQEAYEAHLRDLSKLLRAGAIDAQTFERAQGMASAEIANHYASVAAAGAAALGSLFEENKGVAIASAIINTLEGITAALKLPFPLNWAQGAAVAAAGFAQVAKIRSTTKSSSGGGNGGLSGGGSRGSASAGTSSGGRAGTDGSAGANARGDSAAAASRQAVSITLQGQNFSREQVSQMLEGLNDLIADGAVLKVAA